MLMEKLEEQDASRDEKVLNNDKVTRNCDNNNTSRHQPIVGPPMNLMKRKHSYDNLLEAANKPYSGQNNVIRTKGVGNGITGTVPRSCSLLKLSHNASDPCLMSNSSNGIVNNDQTRSLRWEKNPGKTASYFPPTLCLNFQTLLIPD